MTQGQAAKMTYRGQTYSLASLAQTEKNFSKLDQLILNSRCAGKSISEAADEEIVGEIAMSIMQASLICGADTPLNETKLKLLCSELITFLKDFGYDQLTFDEVVLAFRLNCNVNIKKYEISVEQVKYRGAFFNVEYASDVIANYLRMRNFFDKKLQNSIDGN